MTPRTRPEANLPRPDFNGLASIGKRMVQGSVKLPSKITLPGRFEQFRTVHLV